MRSAKTHMVYMIEYWLGLFARRLYFNGTITPLEDNSVEIDWSWTPKKENGEVFYSTDAWDLLGWARQYYGIQAEVERI